MSLYIHIILECVWCVLCSNSLHVITVKCILFFLLFFHLAKSVLLLLQTFYLRYAGSNQSFSCKERRCCAITVASRTNCKFCRYQKCIRVGMHRKGFLLNTAIHHHHLRMLQLLLSFKFQCYAMPTDAMSCEPK